MHRHPPLLLAALIGLGFAAGCERQPPPGDTARPSDPDEAAPTLAGEPTLPQELAQQKSRAPGEVDAGVPEHKGPWFVVTSAAAAVYSVREFDKEKKIGYVRNGGRVPVTGKTEATKSCSSGWHEVVSGGYLCGNLGTTDPNHPQVKFATKAPNLDNVLPYPYARNAKNGTPLYRSVPSREQMDRYEPYLAEAKKKKQKKKEEAARAREAESDAAGGEVRTAALDTDPETDPSLSEDGGILDVDAGAPEEPWWKREDAKDKLHELTLDKLKEDSDDILAMRLVTGFYIAVDKTFSWNGRTWYKSTKGLIAPADRFWQTAGSKFQGEVLDGNNKKLPMAWVYGGRKTAPTYEIDLDTKKTKPAHAVDVFTALPLTGKEIEVAGIHYSETRDGVWVKNIHVRITRPGPPPADIGPNERWIDVNLKEQTLVVFEGSRAVYATLVSSGKQSTEKDKDHRTPTGQFRIREKHVTTTMDGDGTAAGDLPYSIEDVPYVMYFQGSYALHGAFWHRNFGIQMSHGCVNLAPLDAKWVFLNTNPHCPEDFTVFGRTRSIPVAESCSTSKKRSDLIFAPGGTIKTDFRPWTNSRLTSIAVGISCSAAIRAAPSRVPDGRSKSTANHPRPTTSWAMSPRCRATSRTRSKAIARRSPSTTPTSRPC